MQAGVAVVAADVLHSVIFKPAILRLYRGAQLRQSLMMSQEVISPEVISQVVINLEVISDKTDDRLRSIGRT